MRAFGICEPGGDVGFVELPDPPAPAAGQAVVAVEAAGIGPWDALLQSGGWDVGLRPPAGLGVEGAGRVLAVGSRGAGAPRLLGLGWLVQAESGSAGAAALVTA
jgi:NADPH:quinone reductase-like Zn-dependent oxidoreductase